ncbi:MAG: response regulator [Vampirovibrionales bacterium]
MMSLTSPLGKATPAEGLSNPLLKILIVDDNANHCQGIKQLIEYQSTHRVVGIASSGDEAVRRVSHSHCDLILMDMQMAEGDGVSAIQQIMTNKPDIHILALTGFDDPDLIYRAMRAGARGYLLKTMITTHLIRGIEEINAGRVFMPTSIATKFFDEFHALIQQKQAPDPQRQALLNYLTGREKEVLRLLTEGHTYKAISDMLVISETTVKTHVNNIFQKLQVNDRTQAVLYAIKFGLVGSQRQNA